MNRQLLMYLWACALVPPSLQAQPPCRGVWCPVGGPFGPSSYIGAMAVFGEGPAARLYVGGAFSEIDGRPAQNFAAWDGATWTPIIPGADALIGVLKVLDDGSGPALYAGGQFATIGGTPASCAARWDGIGWTNLGSGLAIDASLGFEAIFDFEYFDSGSGPELYIGGVFSVQGQPSARGIARRVNGNWRPLGSGLGLQASTRLVAVDALASYDDGSGPSLFVGGSFSTADGITATNVARWDGQTWHSLGTAGCQGLPGTGFFPSVNTLTPWSENGQSYLLAGGHFFNNHTPPVYGIAGWDGSCWRFDFGSFEPDGIGELASIETASGPVLYAGGSFTSAHPYDLGDRPAFIARRAGSVWQSPGGFNGGLAFGPNRTVAKILPTFRDDQGPGVIAAGRELRPIAWAAGTQQPILRAGKIIADLDCDGQVGIQDLANLLAAFGMSDDGDLDGDSETTLEDLAILLSRFGDVCP